MPRLMANHTSFCSLCSLSRLFVVADGSRLVVSMKIWLVPGVVVVVLIMEGGWSSPLAWSYSQWERSFWLTLSAWSDCHRKQMCPNCLAKLRFSFSFTDCSCLYITYITYITYTTLLIYEMYVAVIHSLHTYITYFSYITYITFFTYIHSFKIDLPLCDATFHIRTGAWSSGCWGPLPRDQILQNRPYGTQRGERGDQGPPNDHPQGCAHSPHWGWIPPRRFGSDWGQTLRIINSQWVCKRDSAIALLEHGPPSIYPINKKNYFCGILRMCVSYHKPGNIP